MSSSSQNRVPPPEAKPGMDLADIYYILFRRKWLIVVGSALGLIAAAGLYKFQKPLFRSEAKLLVRYIRDLPLTSPGTIGSEIGLKVPDFYGTKIMKTELEILTSQNIAMEVAMKVGPAALISNPRLAPDPDRAAGVVGKYLRAENPSGSDIIAVTFQHSNPEVVTNVLVRAIDSYLRMHVQVHSSDTGSDSNALTAEVVQLRKDLGDVEESIRQLKSSTGLASIEESKKALIERKGKIEQDLTAALAELEGARAALKEQTPDTPPAPVNGVTTVPPAAPVAGAVPAEKGDEYRDLAQREQVLAKKDLELSLYLTPEAPARKSNAALLQATRQAKAKLETEFPTLVGAARTLLAPGLVLPVQPTNSVQALRTQTRTLEARIGFWTNSLQQLRVEVSALSGAEATMSGLSRQKAELEKKLLAAEFRLQQKAERQAAGGDRAPNISPVQSPPPAWQEMMPLYKKMLGILFGGFGGGLALAFLLELVFDRSLKRPKDVESVLPGPLFVTIPALDMPSVGQHRTGGAPVPPSELPVKRKWAGRSTPSAPMDAADPDHPLRPYQEALRDRLINYFEVREMTHKPKMIAVTSCEEGAGVSSTAAGLAATLSETGDGNVLLVDMRGERGAAQAFCHGKAACGIEDALEAASRGNALVHDNLYVVAAGSLDQKLQKMLPRQFGDMVPRLKASDYDYIIFDMPPVGQTSITSKVARFMDMVLMVVESDRTDRDVAKRARALLAESKATVATVLNKRKRYVPKWLLQEFH